MYTVKETPEGTEVISDDLDIAQTFDCGQCFRFTKKDDGTYGGTAFGRYLSVKEENGGMLLRGVSMDEFSSVWKDFFDLDTDYTAIKEKLRTDDIIIRAMEAAGGIRLLRQDLWECLISFIISQNNNIPRIKKIIEAVCARCGSPLETPNGITYTFPSPEALAGVSRDELHEMGCGYRDEYICLASSMVADGRLDLDKLDKMDTADARQTLLSLKGIGGKVADCILLFGMHRTEVCPHDVWVKRIFTEKYHIENITEKKGYAFAAPRWGEYAGIAQQYLFHAERENAI